MKCDHCETMERETVGPLYPVGGFDLCASCSKEWLEMQRDEMMVGGPDETRRWELDGQPCDILDFIDVNGLDMKDVEAIHALEVGETLTYGGGAGADFVLRRVA